MLGFEIKFWLNYSTIDTSPELKYQTDHLNT